MVPHILILVPEKVKSTLYGPAPPNFGTRKSESTLHGPANSKLNAFFKVCGEKCSTGLNKRFCSSSPFRFQRKKYVRYGNNFFFGLKFITRHPLQHVTVFSYRVYFFLWRHMKINFFEVEKIANFSKIILAFRSVIFEKSTKIAFTCFKIISTRRVTL